MIGYQEEIESFDWLLQHVCHNMLRPLRLWERWKLSRLVGLSATNNSLSVTLKLKLVLKTYQQFYYSNISKDKRLTASGNVFVAKKRNVFLSQTK